MEEVIFETEAVESRQAVAESLRSVADRLEAGEEIALTAGGREVSLAPPATVTFEVKAERETGAGAPELSLELELEWDEGAEDAGEGLEIG